MLLLLEHLSHSDNLEVTCCLAQRACNTLRQHQQQQQCRCPLPLSGGSSSSSSSGQGLWQQQQPVQTCGLTLDDASDMDGLAVCSSSGSRHAVTTAQQQLRSACSAVWHPSTLLRTANSVGGGSRMGSSAATAAADAAAGLAGSTLRLLKLLSLPVLDMSSLTVGGMINKGAFSEVFSGTVSEGPVPGAANRAGSGQTHITACQDWHQVACLVGVVWHVDVARHAYHINPLPVSHAFVCWVLGPSLQLQQAAGGAPLPVALKVMDCNEDDACSFERVYNEVRRPVGAWREWLRRCALWRPAALSLCT